MPHETVIEFEQETEASHARKQRHVKLSQQDGIRLLKRDGTAAYLDYCQPYAVEYVPSMASQPEQIHCRIGESCFTLQGRALGPLFAALQVKQCAAIREAPHPHVADMGVPLVETITVRLWL